MENSNSNVEKLKQEQLVNEILSKNTCQNNQAVIDAYVTATTENEGKSIQDIEKRKEQILKVKEAEQSKRNKEQLDTVQREETLSYINSIIEQFSDTDAMIKKWDEEAKKEAYQRRKITNQIIRDLEEQKKPKKTYSRTSVAQKNLEVYERESFRRKYLEMQRKQNNVRNQIKEVVINERNKVVQHKLAEMQEQKRTEQERNAKIQKKTADAFKQYNLNNSNTTKKQGFFKTLIGKIFPKKSTNKPISKKDGTVTLKTSRPMPVNSQNSRTITGVASNAAKAYRGNMESYTYGSVSKSGMFFDKTLGAKKTIPNNISGFHDKLSFSVNERQAQIDAARQTANLQKNKSATR